MKWLENPMHILLIISVCVFIIVAEGIIILVLSREKGSHNYGNSDVAKKVAMFRQFWGSFVIYVLATSIIILFAAKIVFEENITLSDMNNWVGIVLGLVALIVGIISLWLSFYNVEQTKQSQEKNWKDMSDLKDKVENKVNEINPQGIGWQNINDEWSFINKDGNIAKNEWKKSGCSWFYLDSLGKISKNKLIIEGEDKRYLNEDGVMTCNKFVNIDGKKMYFSKNGSAFTNGELDIDSKRYIFKDGIVTQEIDLE